MSCGETNVICNTLQVESMISHRLQVGASRCRTPTAEGHLSSSSTRLLHVQVTLRERAECLKHWGDDHRACSCSKSDGFFSFTRLFTSCRRACMSASRDWVTTGRDMCMQRKQFLLDMRGQISLRARHTDRRPTSNGPWNFPETQIGTMIWHTWTCVCMAWEVSLNA